MAAGRTLECAGARNYFTKQSVQVLMVITRRSDVNLLLRYVKSIDPDAFLSVSSVTCNTNKHLTAFLQYLLRCQIFGEKRLLYFSKTGIH